jgi:hypothetical protein
MRQKTLLLLAASALLLSLFSGCGGHRGVRVTEGSEPIGAAPTGSLFLTNEATVVHVDAFERLATLRNAKGFVQGVFLQTRDREGNESGILKTRALRPSGLLTADILEGIPEINDRATPVSPAESERLGKIYRDPAE